MFHVVLFEPEIPPNTGNAIRLCANTGATLHLVKPLGFRLDDKSLQRSGLDYHDLARRQSPRQPRALACANSPAARLFAVETGGRRRYSDVQLPRRRCILVRTRNRGLPDAVLARVGREN